MLKNNKININLGDEKKASSTIRAKNNAFMRKNWKLLKSMNCTTCANDCGPGLGVCYQMLYTIRVLQLENAGGKSDMLFEVNASEQERTVPIEVYQQLLQAFSDLKSSQTSTQLPKTDDKLKPVEKSAVSDDTRTDAPLKEEKKPSKTRSDVTAAEKPNNPTGKKSMFPSIAESAAEALGDKSDHFDGIDAGSKKDEEPQQLTVEDFTTVSEEKPLPF